MDNTPVKVVILAGTTFDAMARVVGHDAEPLTIADVATVEYSIVKVNTLDRDEDHAIADHTEEDLQPADVLFDSLQKDALWGDRDEVGYNFRHMPPIDEAAAFAEPNALYQLTYTLTPAEGQPIKIRFDVSTI